MDARAWAKDNGQTWFSVAKLFYVLFHPLSCSFSFIFHSLIFMVNSNYAEHVKAELHEATGLYSSAFISLCGPAEQCGRTNLHESFLLCIWKGRACLSPWRLKWKERMHLINLFLHSISLVYPGGSAHMSQYFRGNLAGLMIRSGKLENKKVIDCLYTCKEGLDVQLPEEVASAVKVRTFIRDCNRCSAELKIGNKRIRFVSQITSLNARDLFFLLPGE